VRTYHIAAAVLGVAIASGIGVQACSSSLPPYQSQVGVPPPGVQSPLPMPGPLMPTLPAGQSGPTQARSWDLSNFTPLLALPELRAAADAYAAADYAGCAVQVEAHLQGSPLDPLDEPRWQLLLATLREKSGDLAGAARAYERASQGAWPLLDYAALGLGRCLLALGQPELAERQLERVPSSSAAFATARGLMAEVACRLGSTRTCLDYAESFVAQPRKPAAWAVQSFRIGDMLVNQLATVLTHPAAIENQVRALAFIRSLMDSAPNTAERMDAALLEQRLLAVLPEALRSQRPRLTPKDQLARAEAMENAGRHEEADAAVQALLAELGNASFGPVACQARLVSGKALSDLKQRQRSSERYGEIIKHCKGDDLRAWAFFLGGKVAFQDARYPEAERLLAELERELPRHRLADDARLYRAQAQREMGVEARFSELLDSMPDDYPAGDMTLDGVFLLALSRMEKNDWAGAGTVLRRAVQLAGGNDAQRGLEQSGRERYFQARALIETGEEERGLVEYEALIAELPLSYYMLHAYSRLAERNPDRAGRALQAALAQAGVSSFSIEQRPEFEQPGFLRALDLFRQSDIDAARRELELMDVLGSDTAPGVLWGISLLYARSGSARLSHAVPRWQLHDWLERWPAGSWRQAWELSFPRPHVDAVRVEAKRQGIEPELIYAIMREESAFDPEAVSPANAYGLMQVIAPTARRFGKEAGVPYDRRALTTPAVSIAIGSRVLANYQSYFPGDPLLAIPGYNAGPGRPKRWAKDFPGVDFDVWVELIPYRETRRYTKRVLSSRAAYAFLYYQTPGSDPLRLPRRLSPAATLDLPAGSAQPISRSE
jgi:soluble lytic murein transglycosylase